MADTTLREKIVVDGVETAAAKLNVMTVAAGRVATAFGRISSVAGMLGGIAGVWKIAESVRETDRLYASINRITSMTELGAAGAHVMFRQFAQGGIEMEAAEKIMTSMTRSAEKMSDGFGGVGTQAMLVKSLMSSIGASIKAGPEERLLAMSKAASAGKLNVDQLIRAFMIPRSQAATMMAMLKQGPDRLKEIQRQTLQSGALIDEQALASYRTMVRNRRELREAWGDVVGIFYKNLLPAVTRILVEIKNGFERIRPVAETIGKVLRDHMEVVVRLAKTYLALLIASKAINAFSSPEGQMGIFGRAKQLGQGAMGLLGRGAAKAGSMDYFAARAASPAIGMFETVGGPLMRILGTIAGRLGVIGIVITIAITAFKMLRDNVWGLGSMLKKVFGSILSTMWDTIQKLMGIFKALWQAIEPIAKLFAGALLLQIWLFAKYMEVIAKILNLIVTGLVAIMNGLIFLLNKIPGVHIDLIGGNNKKAAALAADRAPDNKAGAGTVQDFRGSKFEITNNFPTGIDGGRVAVAFGDELARLGERRLDSGLRPLYSYR